MIGYVHIFPLLSFFFLACFSIFFELVNGYGMDVYGFMVWFSLSHAFAVLFFALFNWFWMLYVSMYLICYGCVYVLIHIFCLEFVSLDVYGMAIVLLRCSCALLLVLQGDHFMMMMGWWWGSDDRLRVRMFMRLPSNKLRYFFYFHSFYSILNLIFWYFVEYTNA